METTRIPLVVLSIPCFFVVGFFFFRVFGFELSECIPPVRKVVGVMSARSWRQRSALKERLDRESVVFMAQRKPRLSLSVQT